MEKLELKGGISVDINSTSKQYGLNYKDLLKGLLIAALTPIAITLYDALMTWLSYNPVELDWRELVKTGIAAGVVYVGKNFFDRGKIIIDQKTLEEAKK